MTAAKRGADYVPWCSRPTRVYRQPIRAGWTPSVPSGELAPIDDDFSDDPAGPELPTPCSTCGRPNRRLICGLKQCSELEFYSTLTDQQLAKAKKAAFWRNRR